VLLSEWKAAALAGRAPVDALLRKQYAADSIKSESGESRNVTFTISTGAVDRDRDTVKVEGWRTDAYRKNPVVLWAHDSRSLTLARADFIGTSSGQLRATARFAAPGKDYDPAGWPSDHPSPETVMLMLRGGFLNATSVGFIPMKSMWNDERGGFDFAEQELLEFSIVPVPANPEALIDAKAAGIDVSAFRGWAERILDGVAGAGLWVPRAQAEAAFKLLSEPRVTVKVEQGALVAEAMVVALDKAGRRISAANEERLRNALTNIETSAEGIGAAAEAIEEVLDLATPAQGDEPDDAGDAGDAGKTPPEPTLKLRPDTEPRFAITAEEVRGAVVAAAEEAVRAEIRRHTGRLD